MWRSRGCPGLRGRDIAHGCHLRCVHSELPGGLILLASVSFYNNPLAVDLVDELFPTFLSLSLDSVSALSLSECCDSAIGSVAKPREMVGLLRDSALLPGKACGCSAFGTSLEAAGKYSPAFVTLNLYSFFPVGGLLGHLLGIVHLKTHSAVHADFGCS